MTGGPRRRRPSRAGPRSTAVGAEWAAIRWSAVLGAASTAVGLAVLDRWVVPGGPGNGLIWLVAAFLAGAVALALDSPTRDLTAAAPVSQRFRTGARLALVLPAVAGWAAYVLVSDPGDGRSGWALVLAGTSLVLVGGAAAGGLQRTGMPEPGGLVASALLLLVVGLMVVPLPGELMPFDLSAGWTRATTLWSGAAGVAVVLLWWATADAWRRVPGLPVRKESRAGPPGPSVEG